MPMDNAILLASAAVLGFGLMVIGGVYLYLSQKVNQRTTVEDLADEVESVATDGGQAINIRPPATSEDNLFVKLWKLYRHDSKKKKVRKEGYVQWHLIDDTFSEPKFVKPEKQGGGIPQYEYDGKTYLFPRKALIPAEETGMWTAVHKKGDAMPLNLDTPGRPAIGADELKEYLTQMVTSSPPSWLSQFDIGSKELFRYAILGFIAFVVLQQLLGGAF